MSKATMIDYQNHRDAPVPGAFKVYWLMDLVWTHKGWLMPQIKPTEFRRGK